MKKKEFQNLWNPAWNPAFTNDLMLDSNLDIFDYMRDRVVKYNESYDATVVGLRGGSKSSSTLSCACLYDPKFHVDNICFSVDEWLERTNELAPGSVAMLDEVGTEGSLSSRTSMSKGNRTTADVVQMNRTQRIVTFYVSVDDMRIDKRARQLSTVVGSPINKLSDEQNCGYGLASEIDLKIRSSKPSPEGKQKTKTDGSTGYLEHEVKNWRYGPKGIIKSIIVPHPPMKLWKKYEKVRAKRLEEVMMDGLIEQTVQSKINNKSSSYEEQLPVGQRIPNKM